MILTLTYQETTLTSTMKTLSTIILLSLASSTLGATLPIHPHAVAAIVPVKPHAVAVMFPTKPKQVAFIPPIKPHSIA
jgi:hypothetical protein